MEKLVITIVFCSLTFGWEIDYEQIECTCNQLKLQFECEKRGCFWDSSSQSCDKLKEEPCSTYSSCSGIKHCFYNIKTKTCEEFTICENIPFIDPIDCWKSKPGCEYYISMDKCSKFSCQKYSEKEECPSYRNCFVSKDQCTTFTCSKFTKERCLSKEKCFIDENICRQATCEDLNVEECYYIHNLEQNVLQPCIVEENQCKRAESSSQLKTPFDCVSHTGRLYYWSSNDETKGKCISCISDSNFDLILKILIGLLILQN